MGDRFASQLPPELLACVMAVLSDIPTPRLRGTWRRHKPQVW